MMNIASTSESSDLPIQNCLNRLGLSLLADWDVLVFLYRHQASLTSAEQIARLVGYTSQTVVDAFERLASRGLVERSRASRGVRFYQLSVTEEHLAPESCFRQLIGLTENRSGRLLLVKYLRHGSLSQSIVREKAT